MASAIIDFLARIDPAKRQELDQVLAAVRAHDLRCPFGQVATLHFASVVVFDSSIRPSLLVFENNYEGDLDSHLATMLAQATLTVHKIFACCVDYDLAMPATPASIATYLRAHAVYPAAYHIGNVGRSPDRVRRESALHKLLGNWTDTQLRKGNYPPSQEQAYTMLREETQAAGELGWVLAPHARQTRSERVSPWIRLIGAALLTLPVLLVTALPIAAVLRVKESRDQPMPPSDLDPTHVRRLTEQEDNHVQNHLASITTIKPGKFRRALLRFVLWAANLVARTCTHGSLSGIPSIHFAHWALVGDDQLLFLSNFDGSWESYLDDFIDKASAGLTAIWSNTVGFPKTRWLVLEGARDGAAFKAFARQQQTPTAVWYSAYPELTVQRIDSQSTLREGLAEKPGMAALDEWLRCL